MIGITVASNLWSTSILPEGLIEKWLVQDGAFVKNGEPVVEIRIESALHELQAPSDGQIVIEALANSIVEPGTVIGRVAPISKPRN